MDFDERSPLVPARKDPKQSLNMPKPSDSSSDPEEVPHATMVYAIFFLQGVGVLFPWNAFITVTNYFSSRLGDSTFASSFENFFSFGFQASNIVTLLLALRYQQRISIHSRILYPMVIQFIVFLATTIIVEMKSMSADSFFYFTFASVLVSGAATAFLQGGLFGLAGCLPFKFTQALMSGQGMGGFLIAALNVITLAATSGDGTPNVTLSSLLFFSISVAVVVVCFLGYLYLLRLPTIHHYLEAAKSHQIQPIEDMTDEHERRRSYLPSNHTLSETFSKIKLLAFLVGTNFFVTLSVFPAIADRVVSSANPDSTYAKTFFVPIYCFIGFNLGDWIGRSLAGWRQYPSQQHYRKLTVPILLRFVFIPLFIFCNLDLGSDDGIQTHSPVWFKNESLPYIFMLLMGISNGYYGSLCMMFGPTIVEPKESESAGSMMVVSLVLGLTAGSLFSFALKAMICQCNPFATSNSTSNSTGFHSVYGDRTLWHVPH